MTLITTTHGLMDEALLRKVEGSHENANEAVQWVEYYLGEELVHRSVAMQLKQNVFTAAEAASF